MYDLVVLCEWYYCLPVFACTGGKGKQHSARPKGTVDKKKELDTFICG